jgi:hypothetical protein
MTADDQRLSDMVHALDCELHDAWEARRSALTAGDPDAVAEFKCVLGEIMFQAKRDPMAVLARQEAALAAMMARVTGRAAAASPVAAAPRDLAALATAVYAKRAATVREAATTASPLASAEVPQMREPRKVERGGLPDPASVYARRAATAEAAGA